MRRITDDIISLSDPNILLRQQEEERMVTKTWTNEREKLIEQQKQELQILDNKHVHHLTVMRRLLTHISKSEAIVAKATEVVQGTKPIHVASDIKNPTIGESDASPNEHHRAGSMINAITSKTDPATITAITTASEITTVTLAVASSDSPLSKASISSQIQCEVVKEVKLIKETDPECRQVDSRRARIVGEYLMSWPELGRGHSGTVYACVHQKTEEDYVLKEIPKTKCNTAVRAEVAILKKLKHRNIVMLHELLETQHDYYIGVEYNGREILKIGDFGLSKVFPKGQMMVVDDRRGTSAFIAPELNYHGNQHDGAATDIWSMGITLYVMFQGILPFTSNSFERCDYEVGRKSDPKETPAEMKDLIDRMMDMNPGTRITLDQIREHPWVTDYGKSPLPSKDSNVGPQVEISVEDKKNAVRRVKRTSFRRKLPEKETEKVDQLDFEVITHSRDKPTPTSMDGSFVITLEDFTDNDVGGGDYVVESEHNDDEEDGVEDGEWEGDLSQDLQDWSPNVTA
ncbi:hypothetical protein BGZ83_007716 [Gryganskiella cystojenkinii]|nr:hypothetical protein BGZ83_007716 [Gryganskiella cystojenkinii]